MKLKIDISTLRFHNKNFWIGFFCSAYLNTADEETDSSIYDILDEAGIVNKEAINWWEEFCGYYEGVLDETDGYLEEPAALEVSISSMETLKIEFHPGDIIYYLNNEEIASLGPHFRLQVMPYKKIEEISKKKCGKELYFLLLPIAKLEKKYLLSANDKIMEFLPCLFPLNICEDITRCILNGLG